MSAVKAIIPENRLENDSLPDKASDLIREQIIRGVFPQGSRLVEDELARSMGVSRACVREALLNLEKEGLVIRRRNTCTEVARFTKQDIREIFMLRLSLELLCAEACIAAGTVPFDELSRQLDVIGKAAAEDRTDYSRRIQEDIRFHELIVAASGNRRAYAFWKSIRSQMLTMFYAIPARHFEYFDLFSVENHQKMIAGLKTGDSGKALPVFKEHILHTLEMLSSDMNNLYGKEPDYENS